MSETPRPGHPAGALDVAVERGKDSTVIRCIGELDLATSPRLEEAVQGVAGPKVVIDCSKLVFIDSTGVRTLLRAVDRLVEASVAWQIVPGDALRRVSSALGLDSAMGLNGEETG